MTDSVVRVPDERVDGFEGWERLSEEPEVRGVEAVLLEPGGEWPWAVTVWAGEFVREEPLVSEFRHVVRKSLAMVQGVTAVQQEDREVWIVGGNPSGEALVRGVAEAIDRLAPRIRGHVGRDPR